ncbi:MAG: hypothetical protein HC844_10820 [Tabrizicola sp.]|nr:hypothetical protein [Tabrizicola sp.]
MAARTEQGSKSSDGDDSRDVVISTRIPLAEAERIKRQARAAQISVSRYLRLAATEAWEQLRITPPKPRKLRAKVEMQAVSELNRVGVNLWQIVRHMNRGGAVGSRELHDAIAEVRAAVAKLAGDAD